MGRSVPMGPEWAQLSRVCAETQGGADTLEGQRAVVFWVLIEIFFSLKNFKVVSLVFCSVLCGDVSQGFTQQSDFWKE